MPLQHISKYNWMMMMLREEDNELDPLDAYMKGIDDEVNKNDEKAITKSHCGSAVSYEVMEKDEDDYEAIVKAEQTNDTENATGSRLYRFV